MPIRDQEKRQQLIRDGFCVFENVLDAGTVAKLNAMSEWTIAQEEPEHFARHRAPRRRGGATRLEQHRRLEVDVTMDTLALLRA